MIARRKCRGAGALVFVAAAALGAARVQAQPQTPPVEASGHAQQTDDEARKRADEARRRAQAEEMFLRMQFEVQLNEIARWDAEAGRVVLKDEQQFEGAPRGVIEAAIELVAEPAGGTRLRFRQDIKIRPFVLAFQKFMANGGLEDLQNPGPEGPFADGLPPYVEDFFADLIEALNAQDDDGLDAEQRKRERVREALYEKIERVLRDGFALPEREVERHMRLVRALDRRYQREFVQGRFFERLREATRSERTRRVLERLRVEAQAFAEREDLPPWAQRLRRVLRGERKQAAPARPRAGRRDGTPRERHEERGGVEGPISDLLAPEC